MTYFFVKGAKRFKMSHLYAGFLWGLITFGILILLFGRRTARSPCWTSWRSCPRSPWAPTAWSWLLVTTRCCPSRSGRSGNQRHHRFRRGVLLGMLFYSLVRFGVVVGLSTLGRTRFRGRSARVRRRFAPAWWPD